MDVQNPALMELSSIAFGSHRASVLGSTFHSTECELGHLGTSDEHLMPRWEIFCRLSERISRQNDAGSIREIF